MTSTAKKYARLLTAISEGGETGKVKWIINDWDEEVRAKVGEFQVGIMPGKRGNTNVVNAKVYDAHDRLVDQFDDDDLAVVAPPSGFESYWSYMNDLYKTGRRMASGADGIIDKIIGSIEGEDDW